MQQSRIASCSSDRYSRKLEEEIFVCLLLCPLWTSVESKQSTRVAVRV